MDRQSIPRRCFLHSAAVTASIGIAGCANQQDTTQDDADTTSNTEEPANSDSVQDEPDPSETVPEEEGPDLEYLHGITGQTYPSDLDAEGYYQRRFEWDAVGYEWWFEQSISRALNEYYEKRYSRGRNYDMYVSDTYSDQYIQQVADNFEQFGDEYDLSEREVVDLAVAFVQGLNYTKDDVTTGFDQYTYYPVETLIERGGDCEDSTVLLARILRELGYDCVLLFLPDTEPVAHMALGVRGDSSIPGAYYEYDDKQYYYVETTGEGYRIGDIPDFDGDLSAEFIDIERFPTLLYYYESRVEQKSSVNIDVTMFSENEVSANKAVFQAQFEDRAERIVTSGQTIFRGQIPKDGTTKTITLEPPEERELRLKTGVTTNGELQAVEESEWQIPV